MCSCISEVTGLVFMYGVLWRRGVIVVEHRWDGVRGPASWVLGTSKFKPAEGGGRLELASSNRIWLGLMRRKDAGGALEAFSLRNNWWLRSQRCLVHPP